MSKLWDKIKRYFVKKYGEQTLAEADYAFLAESLQEYEKELTSRLRIDSKTNSWLSRNIRPLSLLIFIAGYFGLGLHGGHDEMMSQTAGFIQIGIGFYFGSRGLEKIVGIIKKETL